MAWNNAMLRAEIAREFGLFMPSPLEVLAARLVARAKARYASASWAQLARYRAGFSGRLAAKKRNHRLELYERVQAESRAEIARMRGAA